MRTRLSSLLVASAVLLLALAGCGDPAADEPEDATETPSASGTPADPASPSEDPTPSPPESEPADDLTTTFTTRDLGQGPPPAIDVLAAADPADPPGTWSLVRPSGEGVELAVDRPFGFAAMGNGLVVLEDEGDGRAAALYVDGTGGEVTREEVLGYALAVTPDGSIAAWLAPDHSVHGVEGGGGRSFELPVVEGAAEIGAITGRGTCFEAESEIGGCTAFVDVDEPRQAWITSSHGIVDVAGPMLSVVDSTGEGQVLGLISVTDEGSCGGLFEKPTRTAWETCDHTLVSFSPDGSGVLGTDAYLDGLGQRTVAFLDAADGTLLREFSSKGRGPTVLQTAWEDEDHVLAVVFERGRWSVVRLGADGTAELSLGPLEGADLDRPFLLAER
jgi:hypothetical protein